MSVFTSYFLESTSYVDSRELSDYRGFNLSILLLSLCSSENHADITNIPHVLRDASSDFLRVQQRPSLPHFWSKYIFSLETIYVSNSLFIQVELS